MAKKTEIICIMCPKACRIRLTVDNEDNITEVSNHQCKEGEKYAVAEYKFPGRVLTTTLLVEGSARKLLPVRTNKPIPKSKLMEVMYFLCDLKVKPPIKIGQVVVTNIMDTGSDLIATSNL